MFTVIGTSTLDLIIAAPQQLPTTAGDEFTTESLVFCEQPLQILPGGNGTNSALVLASIGAPVALCSAVGNDDAGCYLQRLLKKAGVDKTALVCHPEKATSSTTTVTDGTLNRRAFHHHGSSGSFGPKSLSQELLAQTQTLLITGYPLLSQWRPRGVAYLLQQIKNRPITTALDIGPAIGKPVTLQEIRPFLSGIDYVICNQHELMVCTGEEKLTPGIQKLLAAGASTVIAKQGAQGAAFQRSDDTSITHVPGFSTETQLTIGAGDSFNAGLLFALDQGLELKPAVYFANALASLVVGSGQGVLGCPELPQVTQRLKEDLSNNRPDY